VQQPGEDNFFEHFFVFSHDLTHLDVFKKLAQELELSAPMQG
jgi:hypothetical protein